VGANDSRSQPLHRGSVCDEVLQHVSSLLGPLAGREKPAGLCRLASAH
jgi:hypothetical protein